MAMARAIGVNLILLISTGVLGQSSASKPTFEVASVKPHDGPRSWVDITTAGPRLTAAGESVWDLIAYAYDLKNYQFASSPALSALNNAYYDILAEADGDTTPTKAEFRQMLQSLLADRFKLLMHHEMRELPVYDLVVGKNGRKFKESAADAAFSGTVGLDGRNQTITLSKATMGMVADELQGYADRPIVDKTGLTGTYDIKIEAMPGFWLNGNSDRGDISVFAAVQDQLGLKLVPQKAMVDVVVVDHLEKPSEN
jgi:uncharacterized protein (TIGR03435 family)